MSNSHEWPVTSVALVLCLAAVATPGNAANRPYYLCDKQLIVQTFEKDTGKTHYYLVLDKIKWWRENDWDVTRVVPERLIGFDAQLKMHYRGRKCHELTVEEQDALLRKHAKSSLQAPPRQQVDPSQAYQDRKALGRDAEELPLPQQPYVHRTYEPWRALGCEIRGPDGQPIGYLQPCPEDQK
jgi:hypothetical protein